MQEWSICPRTEETWAPSFRRVGLPGLFGTGFEEQVVVASHNNFIRVRQTFQPVVEFLDHAQVCSARREIVGMGSARRQPVPQADGEARACR